MNFAGRNDTCTVKLRDRLSALAMRASCDELFDYIESLPAEEVVVDFDSFRVASRGFIHQYLMRKARSNKKVSEVNMSPLIAEMLRTVKRQMDESKDPLRAREP